MIHHFGKFGKLVFAQPISIDACLALTLVEEPKAANAVIFSHKELLRAYFKIEIEDESGVSLKSLPMILKNYVPSLDRLPDFLLHLATLVNKNKNIDLIRIANLRSLGRLGR